MRTRDRLLRGEDELVIKFDPQLGQPLDGWPATKGELPGDARLNRVLSEEEVIPQERFGAVLDARASLHIGAGCHDNPTGEE
jgi:hypothetical protein